MYKKLLSILGILVLTTLFCSPALASEQPTIKDREQALKRAKQLLPELVTGKEFNIEYREDEYWGKRVWSLDMKSERTRPGHHDLLHIIIDADTAELLNYHHRANPAGQTTIGQAISKEQARNRGLSFVNRMHPGIMEQLRFDDSNPYVHYYHQRNLNPTYYFSWHRVINGIPVQWNGINVEVDALSGRILSYSYKWDKDINVPAVTSNVMPEDQATDVVIDNHGFYPTYTLMPDNKFQLVYRLNSQTAKFDAFTARPVDSKGNLKDPRENKVFSVEFTPEMGGKEVVVVKPTEKIEPSQAQKIAEKFFLQRGLEGKIRYSGSGAGGGPGFYREYWIYSIERESNVGQTFVNVGVDAYTGKIVDYWNYDINNNENVGITRQQASKAAEEFLRRAVDSDLQYVPRDVPQYQDMGYHEHYLFQYDVLVHGVPVEGNSINVMVSASSGEVLSYNYQSAGVDIPEIKEIVSTEIAAKTFRSVKPLELSYVIIRDEHQRPTDKIILAYQLKNMLDINANSGQLLDNITPDGSYTDAIANHWARASLELLATSGLLPTQDFNPDGATTRRDGIKVLVAASQDYFYSDPGSSLKFTDVAAEDPDISTIKRAVQFGFFDNQGQLKPDAPLTREQLAVWVVNGIGYGEVANLPVKIESGIRDWQKINTDYRNHVAIAHGLRIFAGDKEGNFNPKKPVTWAELATVITRAAPKLNKGN